MAYVCTCDIRYNESAAMNSQYMHNRYKKESACTAKYYEAPNRVRLKRAYLSLAKPSSFLALAHHVVGTSKSYPVPLTRYDVIGFTDVVRLP